jgi:hypothetical protein
VDSLAQIPRANRDEQVHTKAAASATIVKCGPAAAVKIQMQHMDLSKLTLPEIHEFFIFKSRKKW